MINTRLFWKLESNNLISPVQSLFRSERSTNDNLMRLETFIPDAFIKKKKNTLELYFSIWKTLTILLVDLVFYVIYMNYD